ncbi:MAG: DEAD/DEAH box helicase [Thermomicrobiales bacterium]
MPSGFQGLGLSDDVLRALDEIGFEEPTPVQREAIPPLMQGRDVIAQAQTGTGKTGAFAPADHRAARCPSCARPQALVLTPTRELAVQVAEAFHRLWQVTSGIIAVLPVYGGQPIDRQLRALRQAA